MPDSSTIAALATAPFPGGVAVVRVSGDKAEKVSRQLFSGSQDPFNMPRTMCLGDIIDPVSKEKIDFGMLVYMPGPNSFTGENVVEFHLHGSPLVSQRVLKSLYTAGAEPAEPGEFTKRAFLSGKMDLAQAEAVADLINAKSNDALKIANEQLAGRFSKTVEKIGEPLRDLLAELEAHIDFPEEDIEPDAVSEIRRKIKLASDQIAILLKSYKFGQVVRDGVKILLCGLPNAGKSSLLNMFLGRERAIVSEISGTTRDLIEENALISGRPFVFCDSAGMRESQDKIEQIGVELAKSRIPWADIIFLVVDANDPNTKWRDLLKTLVDQAKTVWIMFNKVELYPTDLKKKLASENVPTFFVSAKTKEGEAQIVAALNQYVDSKCPDKTEGSEVVTNERHEHCLREAKDSLDRIDSALGTNSPLEILSADLRNALNNLQEIVGKTYTEDILSRIFGKFCIGK